MLLNDVQQQKMCKFINKTNWVKIVEVLKVCLVMYFCLEIKFGLFSSKCQKLFILAIKNVSLVQSSLFT